MSEFVIRHRGGGRDENGQLIPADSLPMVARAVAPVPSSGNVEYVERAREGESIACTVYFDSGTDIVNSDELTVRGERFGIIVNDWRSPWTDRGGLEVLCTRGQG